MRLAWICLVACGSQADPVAKTAEPPPAPAKPTGIPAFTFAAGDKLQTLEDGTMDATPDPKVAHVITHRHRTLEVLDTGHGFVTRARIHYERDEQTAAIRDEPIEDKTLVGDDYFATWNDDKLALVPSDPASPLDLERERRLLDDVRAYVGQRDYLLDAVAGKPLPAVGAPIELPADRMGYALGDQCTVSHATARLLEVKRTSAVFEEVLAFHAVDRATPYAVTALMLVEVSLATGHRTKQTTYATLAWAGMSFELQDVVRYRYFTKRK